VIGNLSDHFLIYAGSERQDETVNQDWVFFNAGIFYKNLMIATRYLITTTILHMEKG
jgi:hypothetical protein